MLYNHCSLLARDPWKILWQEIHRKESKFCKDIAVLTTYSMHLSTVLSKQEDPVLLCFSCLEEFASFSILKCYQKMKPKQCQQIWRKAFYPFSRCLVCGKSSWTFSSHGFTTSCYTSMKQTRYFAPDKNYQYYNKYVHFEGAMLTGIKNVAMFYTL